jgi:hypothetical protein
MNTALDEFIRGGGASQQPVARLQVNWAGRGFRLKPFANSPCVGPYLRQHVRSRPKGIRRNPAGGLQPCLCGDGSGVAPSQCEAAPRPPAFRDLRGACHGKRPAGREVHGQPRELLLPGRADARDALLQARRHRRRVLAARQPRPAHHAARVAGRPSRRSPSLHAAQPLLRLGQAHQFCMGEVRQGRARLAACPGDQPVAARQYRVPVHVGPPGPVGLGCADPRVRCLPRLRPPCGRA